MKKLGFDSYNATHYKPFMLLNSLKTLCFLTALQLSASDVLSDNITKQLINDYVGNYEVVGVEVYKNELKMSDAEAAADESTNLNLAIAQIELKPMLEESFSLELMLEGGARAIWKMIAGEFTVGDEALGIDGHTLRTGTFEKGRVGWRKINFGLMGNTQSRVVETIGFEDADGTVSLSQHKVYYEYPVGTSKVVPRKLTLEFVYKLKKIK